MTAARLADLADILRPTITGADRALAVAIIRQATAMPAKADIAERDRLIGAYYRRRQWDARSKWAAAIAIILALQRYEIGEFRQHRKSPTCPESTRGSERGELWHILKSAPDFPRTTRRMYEILKRST